MFAKIKVLDGIGCPYPYTLIKIPGEKPRHFFMSYDNIWVYDGAEAIPVFEETWRDWIFQTMQNNTQDRTFAVANPRHSEIWLCFATTGSNWPDCAVVWNYLDNAVTLRDLGPTKFIARGLDFDSSAFSAFEGMVPYDDDAYFACCSA